MDISDKIKIIVIGKCNQSANNVRDKIQSNLNVIFISSNSVDDLYCILESNTNVAAVIICCKTNLTEEREYSIIRTIKDKYPHIAMIGVTDYQSTKEHLHKCYNYGIMDHMIRPVDDFEIEMVCNKLQIIINLYRCRINLEGKINESLKLQETINKMMKKYVSLLTSTHTCYLILDENCKITDANQEFAKLMDSPNISSDIIGHDLSKWIVPEDYDKFQKAWKDMTFGNEVDDIQVRIIQPKDDNAKVIWVRIRGNCIMDESKKIVCIIKDISEKKTKEEIERIQDAKKRDAIRQNILSIQSRLSPIIKEYELET